MEILATLITAVLLIGLIATLAGYWRSMPSGLAMASPLLPADTLTFLTDLTYRKNGELVSDQQILPEILTLICEAESFIIIDIFLYNDLHNSHDTFPQLSRKVTQALLEAKEKTPSLALWIISDPTNTGYGSYENPYFKELEAAGAIVVLSNLDRLPNSNLLYTGFWTIFCKPFGIGAKGWLPSPFHPKSPRFSLRGWLALFNFKANHRKVVLTDKAGLITSANISHDASAANSNIAFRFSGPLLAEVLHSEEAVVALSGLRMNITMPDAPEMSANNSKLQLLTEGKIKAVLLEELEKCQPPGTIWMAMFYLADRQIIAALLAASLRGITVNLILDANSNAFGHKKNGVPNRPVAAWLKKKSSGRINIRWYNSHDEQFHSKLIMFRAPRLSTIMGGSANLTRRNISDFNLETYLRIISPTQSVISKEVLSYFQRLWDNENGEFTVDYKEFADNSLLKYWQYQIQERTGFSLF